MTSIAGIAGVNEFQFTGRENEGNGVYYYRARYYSPVLGRFISEDPLGFKAGDPNLYEYVFDDPTNFLDPNGQCPWCIIGAIGGAFGALEEGIKGYNCGARGWDLAKDIGRGFVSGGLGSLAGLATENPMVGSIVSDGVNAALGGHVTPGDVLINAGTAGILGPLGEAMTPEVRGGWNFNPWTSPRTWGPKATQAYTHAINDGALNTAAHLGRSCGCD